MFSTLSTLTDIFYLNVILNINTLDLRYTFDSEEQGILDVFHTKFRRKVHETFLYRVESLKRLRIHENNKVRENRDRKTEMS